MKGSYNFGRVFLIEGSDNKTSQMDLNPGGVIGNSPSIYGWGRAIPFSPEGTALSQTMMRSVISLGLKNNENSIPTINGWAILCCPFVTKKLHLITAPSNECIPSIFWEQIKSGLEGLLMHLAKVPFHYFQPVFFAGVIDDPILLLKIKTLGSSFLVDCGQIDHIAKKAMKRVEAVFITHAHMDHFIGMDKFTRSILVSDKTVHLFGPPGIAEKLYYRLKGYDWNLVEAKYCAFQVSDVYPDHLQCFSLRGAEGFAMRELGMQEKHDGLIYENEYAWVHAAQCDHKIPCLIFKFTEKPYFLIDEETIEQRGYLKGAWIEQLRQGLLKNGDVSQPLKVPRQSKDTIEEIVIDDYAALYQQIAKKQDLKSIGYLTDIGFTEENRQVVVELMTGASILIAECSYKKEHVGRARKFAHLCTEDCNELVAQIRPQYFLPVHFSKIYLNETESVYDELEMPKNTTLIPLPERLTPQPVLAPSYNPLSGI